MPSASEPIVLHDTLGVLDMRPPRKTRFKHRPRRVSRHDVVWKDVKPALERPARPWDRPIPRPMGRRARTHGRAAQRRGRKLR